MQPELGLLGGRKKSKRRARRKGCQEFNGIRFAPWHPIAKFGRDRRLARTWPGLRRDLGRMKTQCHLNGHNQELITIRATEDGGQTWRAASSEELYLFMESNK